MEILITPYQRPNTKLRPAEPRRRVDSRTHCFVTEASSEPSSEPRDPSQGGLEVPEARGRSRGSQGRGETPR
eukprot:3711410-Prymnesium_polylepis.2